MLSAAFSDAHYLPPTGWTGPVFKLSQNYPATLPALEPASQRPWTQFDFTKPADAPKYPDPRKAIFPSHTVSCKLLFTTTPVSEAPFLADSFEWEGDINRAGGTGARPKVRLLQVDVAVKDPRANSTTGWVFGTFQYEKASSTSANWWDHLVPVGLMWGSDVASLKANQQTTQEWINTNRGQKLHLGRKDQVLNGPVDNPNGSCTACHGFAQIARVNSPTPAIPGVPVLNASNATLDGYFANIKAATRLSPDYISVDYSLQLQLGIARAINAGQATLPNLPIAGRSPAPPAASPAHIHEVTRGD